MLQDKAMLATLSISQWTAQRQDRKVTVEVERAHGAHDAGKFKKDLVDRKLLMPISQLSARIREFHYCMTLPWADSGVRLLPSKLFMDYTAKIRAFKAEFEQLVRDMLAKYPSEVQAARVRLGSMYDPGEYPDAGDLACKFKVGVSFDPVPTGNDFRVDVGEEAKAELRASVTESVHARQAEAVKATYARIKDVVSKIEERMSDPKAIFKGTLITNAIELCAVLDGLNITDDPAITATCEDIRKYLLMPPSMLRISPILRAATAQHAARILATLP